MKKTTDMRKVSMGWLAVFAIVSYAIIAIASDIFANKMLLLGPLTLAGGILLIPFSFTIRDLIHKLIGFENVKKVVWVTAFVNLAVAALLILLDILPAAVDGMGEAWHLVMGTSWRVILASFIAQLVADLTNTYVYEWIYRKMGSKMLWFRTAVSNLPATIADSLVFSLIAFLGVLPTEVVWASIVSSFIVKYIVSLVFVPMVYLNEKTTKKE